MNATTCSRRLYACVGLGNRIPMARTRKGCGYRDCIEATFGYAFTCLLFAITVSASAEPLVKGGVALHIIESGQFRAGLAQGLEIDLVNGGDKPATVDVQLVLHRDGQEVKRTTAAGVTLPGHARQGFRVAEPLAFGKCEVTYDIKVNGERLASDEIEFESSGPFRVSTRPWVLTKNATQVMLELLDPNNKAGKFRFKLLDEKRRKVLFQTEEFERVEIADPGQAYRSRAVVQSFVEFGRNRPGDYVVEVDVLEGETVTAQLHLLTSNRP